MSYYKGKDTYYLSDNQIYKPFYCLFINTIPDDAFEGVV